MTTALTSQALATLKTLPLTNGSADIVWHPADVAGNTFPINGPCMLVATNADSVLRHVTVTSAADGEWARKGDITSYPVPAAVVPAVVTILGIFKPKGWQNASDNLLHVTADNVLVQLALIQLPPSY